MPKKRKITKLLENEPRALKGERYLVRVKGKLYDVTDEEESNIFSAFPDHKKLRQIMKQEGVNSYTTIHQHLYPRNSVIHHTQSSLPSAQDFAHFLIEDKVKTMIVVQQNPETGEIAGEYLLRKSRKTKKSNFRHTNSKRVLNDRNIINSSPYLRKVYSDTKNYWEAFGGSHDPSSSEDRKNAIEKIAMKYHLKVKFVPEPGYRFTEGTGFFKEGLEGKVETFIGVSGILLSIFFLSSNFTGNVISNLSLRSSNIIGVVLFLIGIVGVFFYFINKNK